MANGIDPDYESSHQDLHCLHRYNVCDLVCSVEKVNSVPCNMSKKKTKTTKIQWTLFTTTTFALKVAAIKMN